MIKSFDVLFRDNFHILIEKLELFSDISKTFVYKNIQLNMYLHIIVIGKSEILMWRKHTFNGQIVREGGDIGLIITLVLKVS